MEGGLISFCARSPSAQRAVQLAHQLCGVLPCPRLFPQDGTHEHPRNEPGPWNRRRAIARNAGAQKTPEERQRWGEKFASRVTYVTGPIGTCELIIHQQIEGLGDHVYHLRHGRGLYRSSRE